jgi:hypothetical protein
MRSTQDSLKGRMPTIFTSATTQGRQTAASAAGKAVYRSRLGVAQGALGLSGLGLVYVVTGESGCLALHHCRGLKLAFYTIAPAKVGKPPVRVATPSVHRGRSRNVAAGTAQERAADRSQELLSSPSLRSQRRRIIGSRRQR